MDTYSPQKEIVNIIKEAKDRPHSNPELFENAATLLTHLSHLASTKARLKQAVAQFKAKAMDEGASAAKADTLAEASDDYLKLKYAESIWELGLEGVKLFKKMLDDKEEEYNQTK